MSVGLPSGMVTFVLTDVEGSTRLFRRIGERYPPLLERHREVLHQVWQAHGGQVVAAEGDAFFVAFADAAAALAACAEAQRAMEHEPWPPDAVIRVRMGVHSGTAAPRGDGYVAFAAHQAARVADAANGGQVVVSAATAHRLGPEAGAPLVRLGRFRVRDFDEPVELYQLDIDGTTFVGAALRALPAERHNLLQPLTTLIGRDHEMLTLPALMREHRLVSVVGTGGLGKTRLAIEYGLAHACDVQHGVWFADLSRIDDPADIGSVLAEAVGLALEHDRDVWGTVIDHLRSREAVVLIDNCEHLGEEVARRVAELLSTCPAVRVVATSREPLGLRGERIWRPAPLAPEAAIELFCRLAGIVDPDPALATAIHDLCLRLDGLPLAIELAAARADQIPPTEIVAGLDAGHGLGASRDPTLSRRQRSLEELIAWSYALLTDDEQRLFRHLGVFESGFDLDTATAALDRGLEPATVSMLMHSLLDKSLVVVDPSAFTTRYRMHVTVRTAARHLLDTHVEHQPCATRLAHHYLDSFGPQIDGTNTERDLTRRRTLELDNLRHLVPTVAAVDQPTALTLAVVVVDTVKLSSRRRAIGVGLSFLEQLDESHPERVALLDSTGGAASGSGDLVLARQLTEQALALRAVVGEPAWLDGAIDEARAMLALSGLDPATALAIARAGLEATTTSHGSARLHGAIGCASVETGDLETAEKAFEQELAHYSEATAWRAVALLNLADVALRRGEVERGVTLVRSALVIAAEVGHNGIIALAIYVAARIAAATGDWRSAMRLAHCARTQFASIGVELVPSDRALLDELVERGARRLEASDVDQQRQLGEAMDLAEGLEAARTLLETTVPEPGGSGSRGAHGGATWA